MEAQEDGIEGHQEERRCCWGEGKGVENDKFYQLEKSFNAMTTYFATSATPGSSSILSPLP